MLSSPHWQTASVACKRVAAVGTHVRVFISRAELEMGHDSMLGTVKIQNIYSYGEIYDKMRIVEPKAEDDILRRFMRIAHKHSCCP